MNSNNFKLNNWVEVIQKRKGYYTTIQNSSLSLKNVDKAYKPIDINNNWIEVAFKFKRYPYSIGGQIGWHHPTVNNFSVLLNKKTYWVEYVDGDNYCHKEQFTYVHELQNLFNNFTNKEII